MMASADIRIIVNSTYRNEIFGDELNDKKAAKRIQRKLRGTHIKKLGCIEEGSLEDGLRIVGGTCFMQAGNCGFNAVNELTKYVQSFMNSQIVYVNCSAKFHSERIPMGEAVYTWNEAIDKVLEMQSNIFGEQDLRMIKSKLKTYKKQYFILKMKLKDLTPNMMRVKTQELTYLMK